MPSSLTVACSLTARAQPFQRSKSTTSTITTNFTLNTTTSTTPFTLPQCKPGFLSLSSTNRSLVPYAAPPRGDGVGPVTEKLSDLERYNVEREIITEKVDILENKVQELVSKPKTADQEPNTDSSSEFEGILKDSYSLGLQVLELESKNPTNTTPNSTTQLFETMLSQFNQASLRLKDGLVTVDPKPNPGETSQFIDQMVREMVDAYYHEEPPVLVQIDGNYAPIRRETPPTNPLPITNGQLPDDINGMYLRVGPDPVFDPEANYKWMDGDGMVHGVRIENGSAYYVSRYVKNSRYLQEKEFGKAKFFKYGDMEGAYGLFVVYIQLLRERLEVLDMTYGHTTSNVGLVYHAGRVMALEDFGKPYVLSVNADGDLETIGMNNYGGKLDHNFTPHPKKDPVTGEMFIVGLGHTAPYATYTVVNRDGEIRNPVPITVSGPTYLHDLAITENYAIIMDNPYVFSPEKMVVKDKWVFSFDATKKSRFGILPRYATDEKDIKWFEFQDPFFVFHTANAWEEEDKVILYCCVMEPIYNSRTGDFDILPTAFRNFTNKVNRDGPPLSLTLPDLFKLTFNMSTGETTKERIPTLPDSKGVDNPKINEAYMARKCRYIYTNQFTENGMAIGVIKYDVETGIRQRISFSPGTNVFFSEHVFVPKQSPTSEDDGYLLNFVHYENINTTVLFVIDAQTLGRICSIELQTRIPYGYHSIFVSKEELASQVRSLP